MLADRDDLPRRLCTSGKNDLDQAHLKQTKKCYLLSVAGWIGVYLRSGGELAGIGVSVGRCGIEHAASLTDLELLYPTK